ncbi:Hypothetical protein FKW44_004998, partial [Caligus rogercresseyi]
FALVAAGLLALTFSTDNWQVIKVDRDAIWVRLLSVSSTLLALHVWGTRLIR